MILLDVQDAKYNHAVFFNALEKLVRKSPGNQATEATMVNRPMLWMLLQQTNRTADFR